MFSQIILMSEPKHFKIDYEINSWMNKKDQPDVNIAQKQWIDLHHLVLRLGGYVHYVEPVENLPDLCFTANAGLYHNGKIILSKFKHEERQGETNVFRNIFKKIGLSIVEANRDFEGAGDSFIVNDILFLGSSFRSDPKVGSDIIGYLDLKAIVHCELVDSRFYHLDTCFCPLVDNKILLFPGAFSPATLNVFKSLNFRFIEVNEEDANKFACNSVILKQNGSNHVILPSGCKQTESELQRQGFLTHALEMDQFMKAGGACKCLTLSLGHF